MGIKKEKIATGIGIITAAALLGAIRWWPPRPANLAASLTLSTATIQQPDVSYRQQDRRIESTMPAKSASNTRARTTIRQKMKSATDWYALALETLPQAQAGDPEAQFVLFEAIGGCEDGVESLGARSASLEAARDDAIRKFPAAPDLISKYESGYKRCHGFYADHAARFGDSWDWLQKATDAGYAPALAATAVQRLQQDSLKASARAGDAGGETANLAPIGGDANPRELLTAAVQSGDPDVLSDIGEMQRILNPDQPRDVSQIIRTAWGYVACQRGADCSDFGEDMAIFGPSTVTNCGPSDHDCTPVPEMFLRRVKYNWAPVQEIVDQINTALKAKAWDQLPGLTKGG